MKNVLIFHNIVSPYKTLLFNELNRLLKGNLEVVYFAETAGNREWHIDFSKIEYNYTLLNHGKLEDVSEMKLNRQVFSYLLKNANRFYLLTAGEYIKTAYWTLWLFGICFRKKFAVFLESHEKDRKRNFFKEAIKKVFLSQCNVVFAAGEKHKQYARKLGVDLERIAVIHGVGGVDKKVYDAYLKRFDVPHAKRNICELLHLPNISYFIFVGRLAAEKNIMLLLRSYYHIVCSHGETWGLLLLGSGPELNKIQSFIKDKKLSKVYLPGFIQQQELPNYYLISDVFVLPSISEPWGLVADEAITLKKPVLLSDRCGCAPDIIRDGENGLIFDPLNECALYDVMKKVVTGAVDLEAYGRYSFELSKKYTTILSAQIIADKVDGLE